VPDTPRPTPDPADATHPVEPSAPADPVEPSAPADPVAPAEGSDTDTAAAPGPVPSEAELEQIAEPATVRRAPRYGAFLVAGGVLGLVAGIALAVLTGPDSPVRSTGGGFLPFLDGQGAVRTVMGVTGAVVGVVVGGLLALVADRRSGRRAR
jgi:hypothetical protein